MLLIEKGCRLNGTGTKKISKFGLIIYPENETFQGSVLVRIISDTSFLSLRGTEVTKQSCGAAGDRDCHAPTSRGSQ